MTCGCRHNREDHLGGFTIVELLTVVALIVTIMALAIPNFIAMMREQRMTAAVNTLQVAVTRARTYAINAETDHSVEFCSDGNSNTYLRIEAESAYLESIPSLYDYLRLTQAMRAIPRAWYYAFLSHRDAWGSDGVRLLSGVCDFNWGAGTPDPGWGHLDYDWVNWTDNFKNGRLFYDNRPGYLDKLSLTRPWRNTNSTGSVSADEYVNAAGTHGYQDVDDDYFVTYIGADYVETIRDNLAVDDFLYLPYGITVDYAKSTLSNYDQARNSSGADVCRYGWDNTPDLRFGKTGYLLQSTTPDIVLKRNDQYLRLQVIRGTGRLRKMQ